MNTIIIVADNDLCEYLTPSFDGITSGDVATCLDIGDRYTIKFFAFPDEMLQVFDLFEGMRENNDISPNEEHYWEKYQALKYKLLKFGIDIDTLTRNSQ